MTNKEKRVTKHIEALRKLRMKKNGKRILKLKFKYASSQSPGQGFSILFTSIKHLLQGDWKQFPVLSKT